MGKFDGILLCTDLDGTLLRKDKTVSEENRRAIEYFKNEGGLFTVITGRVAFYSGDIFSAVEPNAPAGCGNGGGLFDTQTGQYLWQMPLPERAKELIADMAKKFPEIGIWVNTFHKAYFFQENDLLTRIRNLRGLPRTNCTLQEIAEPMAKATFCADAKVINALQPVLDAHPLAKEFTLVRSEETLYEMLPKGVGKHLTIQKLTEFLHLDPKKTVAVGDYYNDLPMLQAAGTAIAVANAVPEVKAVADHITVSNEEHAIARIIADLERGELKL